jgi:hypothetical protein
MHVTTSTAGRSDGRRQPSTEVVRQIDVPAAARERTTFSRVDYEDAFLVDAGSAHDRTGEEWARVVMEGAPAETRSELGRGWSALGLRLRPVGSDGTVLGWEIRDSTPEIALLHASGRLGISGELLFEQQPDGWLFATFVRLGNPLARVTWARVAPRHRAVVRHLLTRAAAEVTSQPVPEPGRG